MLCSSGDGFDGGAVQNDSSRLRVETLLASATGTLKVLRVTKMDGDASFSLPHKFTATGSAELAAVASAKDQESVERQNSRRKGPQKGASQS
eukprot:SAG31_NODE_4208_length_3473_cov_2.441612_3_plen_92_part_00